MKIKLEVKMSWHEVIFFVWKVRAWTRYSANYSVSLYANVTKNPNGSAV